ncbi:uncharacterized protein si:cabz01074946.1 [Thalassophryne amazonica]|uniref:uncharacterized protein si:cabz01074946.1 n=1 Tax=Thalassophryne amazonica TaxID=390379 RepID=UPI001470E872|nr:uncharacterized protein si:cabz01074946.1 [Thalassophryne amazonica]
MRLQALVVVLFQVGLSASVEIVSGYLGDSVTLPSGIDPSWSLATIEWSIFTNITLIATYRRGEVKTERFWRYKTRLGLNTSSGDLTIRNLSRDDAIKYTVNLINTEKDEFINNIKVSVSQRLQQPTVQKLFSLPEDGGCLMALRCSSPDEGVDISWQIRPAHTMVLNMTYPQGRASVLLASLSDTSESQVEFICTSSRSVDRASSALVETCHDKPELSPGPEPTPDLDYKPNPDHTRDRFSTGFLVGLIVPGFLMLLYCLRGYLRKNTNKRNAS